MHFIFMIQNEHLKSSFSNFSVEADTKGID